LVAIFKIPFAKWETSSKPEYAHAYEHYQGDYEGTAQKIQDGKKNAAVALFRVYAVAL
jgi:hypothetical protein